MIKDYVSIGSVKVNSPRRGGSLKKQHGYTIVEMVIVLVLIGILSTAAASLFFSTSTYNMRTYYSEVLNSIRYARKLAIGQGVHIQVDLTSNSITLRHRTEGVNCTTGNTFLPIIDPIKSTSGYIKTAPSKVTITPAMSFYFDGLGSVYTISGLSSCPKMTTATITVQSGADSNTITITGETGFISGTT